MPSNITLLAKLQWLRTRTGKKYLLLPKHQYHLFSCCCFLILCSSVTNITMSTKIIVLLPQVPIASSRWEIKDWNTLIPLSWKAITKLSTHWLLHRMQKAVQNYISIKVLKTYCKYTQHWDVLFGRIYPVINEKRKGVCRNK